MNPSIYLNNQFVSIANKVSDVFADGNLPFEFQVAEPTRTDFVPEFFLSGCLVSSKKPCKGNLWHIFGHTLSVAPSPRRGRG